MACLRSLSSRTNSVAAASSESDFSLASASTRRNRRPTVSDAPPLSLVGERRQQARDGVRRLYAALDNLSPASRVAFALFAIDGRPVAEVAELTGATVTATKVRLWRARRQLDAAAAADPVLRELLTDGGTP